jgi:LL-diaminopimelate aminotransferase
MQVAQRLTRLPPFLFQETRRRVQEARDRGVDVISLGVGDPDQPTPPHVLDALARAATDPANHTYPAGGTRGLPEFRDAAANWYASRFDVTLDPELEVMALIGSKEGNHHLAMGVLDAGDVAIVPDPAYPSYLASANVAGAEVARIPLRPENGFMLDFNEITPELAARSRLLWLSYPNNPTTAVAPLRFFERAVTFAHEHDVWLVNDNPYSEIAFDGVRPHSILEIPAAREVAVEFNSLSKTYNMAGWRIGMAVGNATLIDAMARVKETTDSGVCSAVQHAGVAALEGPQAVVERMVAAYQGRRDMAVEMLRAADLSVTPPAGTFYIWLPSPPGVPGVEFASRLLELAGVVVTAGAGYGDQGRGYVRLSLSVDDVRLKEALERIADVRHKLS